MNFSKLELLKDFAEHNQAPPEFQRWLYRGLLECWQTGKSLDECLGIPEPKYLALARAVFILVGSNISMFENHEIAKDLSTAIRTFEKSWKHVARQDLPPLYRAIHDAEKAIGVTPKNWRRLQEKIFD